MAGMPINGQISFIPVFPTQGSLSPSLRGRERTLGKKFQWRNQMWGHVCSWGSAVSFQTFNSAGFLTPNWALFSRSLGFPRYRLPSPNTLGRSLASRTGNFRMLSRVVLAWLYMSGKRNWSKSNLAFEHSDVLVMFVRFFWALRY